MAAKKKSATAKAAASSAKDGGKRSDSASAKPTSSNPIGAVLFLLVLGLIGYWFYQRAHLRDLNPGEIYVTGTVARGPGANCWILNSQTGERFSFFGVELGKLRTVGVTAKVIARPEPDKQSPCRQGRVITVLDYRILEKPNYDR